MSAELKALLMKGPEILAAVCHLSVCALLEAQKDKSRQLNVIHYSWVSTKLWCVIGANRQQPQISK